MFKNSTPESARKRTLLLLLLISVQRLSGTYRDTASLEHRHVQTRIANSRRGMSCPARGKQYHMAFDSCPLKGSGLVLHL